VYRPDNLTTFMCRLSRNSEASASWNLKGLFMPVAGKLYLYLYISYGTCFDIESKEIGIVKFFCCLRCNFILEYTCLFGQTPMYKFIGFLLVCGFPTAELQTFIQIEKQLGYYICPLCPPESISTIGKYTNIVIHMLIKLFLKYYECYPILVIKIHEDILHNLC
jgi:hypothetical protein